MTFSWTRYSRATPEALRRRPGTYWARYRERMRTTPIVILILRWASSRTRWRKTLPQKMATTWWQEFRRKSHSAPLVHLQESKNSRSPSQPQFCSENTPVTIELDQILLANKNNSANFHNNINRISKLPKSPTNTMATFDGNSEIFELFEDLFETSLKIHSQLAVDKRINYFHSLMRRDALQTFKINNGPTRENLWEFLAVSQRKYVRPQSIPTATEKFQKLFFNPASQKLEDFLDELQKLAKDAFGRAAHATIEQFIYAKKPPHLKKLINQALWENGTYEQVVTHLEREMELNGLEAPDELQVNTVSQQLTNTFADRLKQTFHHCKKPDLL